VDGFVPVGEHNVVFDANNLSSGVYILRLTAGEYSQSHGMVLLR